MAEVETKEVELGAVQTMAEYNKARDEGKTTVLELPEKPEVEEKEPETTEETKQEDKPKVKGGFQRKIDRLTKAAAEAQERAEKAEARARELEAKSGKTEEKPAAKANGKPSQDDFKTYEDYIEALTDWKVSEKLRVQAEEEEAESEAETVSEIVEAYKERVVAARAKYEDYDEVVSESVKSPWPEKNPSKLDLAAAEAFRAAVFEDENAAEIAYYYGKHPDEFMKLGGLTPAQVVKAVARLSDKLGPIETEEEEEEAEEVEEKPAKIVSKSAPPIKPVSAGNTKSTVPLDRVTSMAEYNKLRDAGRVR